jgi:hypothetical protein
VHNIADVDSPFTDQDQNSTEAYSSPIKVSANLDNYQLMISPIRPALFSDRDQNSMEATKRIALQEKISTSPDKLLFVTERESEQTTSRRSLGSSRSQCYMAGEDDFRQYRIGEGEAGLFIGVQIKMPRGRAKGSAIGSIVACSSSRHAAILGSVIFGCIKILGIADFVNMGRKNRYQWLLALFHLSCQVSCKLLA